MIFQHRWALWSLLGVLVSFNAFGEAQGQGYPAQVNQVPISQPGEWQFDGNSWQYKSNGSGVSPVPGNNIPTYPAPKQTSPPSYQPSSSIPPIYPAPQPYSSSPYPYQSPSKGVQVIIGGNRLQFSYGSPSYGMERWEVKFKKSWNDPWILQGYYPSSASAFEAGHTLSQKGFFAGVTRKLFP